MDATASGKISAITPGQVRAARALLDWSRERLAVASGVPARTLHRMENGEAVPRAATLTALRSALEAAGVIFVAENGEGPGVRLRKERGA